MRNEPITTSLVASRILARTTAGSTSESTPTAGIDVSGFTKVCVMVNMSAATNLTSFYCSPSWSIDNTTFYIPSSLNGATPDLDAVYWGPATVGKFFKTIDVGGKYMKLYSALATNGSGTATYNVDIELIP